MLETNENLWLTVISKNRLTPTGLFKWWSNNNWSFSNPSYYLEIISAIIVKCFGPQTLIQSAPHKYSYKLNLSLFKARIRVFPRFGGTLGTSSEFFPLRLVYKSVCLMLNPPFSTYLKTSIWSSSLLSSEAQIIWAKPVQ